MYSKIVTSQACLMSLILFIAATGLRAQDTATSIVGSEGAFHCKLSPDGKQIVFASTKTGEAKMYVMPSGGGDPVLVECGLTGDHHTGWSPDSKYLLFDAYSPDGPPPGLWRISAAGGKAERLVPDAVPAFQPAFSPDGEWVAFAYMKGGDPHIWKAKLNGDSLTQITSGEAADHHPQWSPDGKSIVFASNRSGNWDIWKINCDDGQLTQITTAPESDDQPMVSPDGKLIAFMSNRSGKRDIWLIPVDGGMPRQFTHDGVNAWPSFSPDGKNLLWSSNRDGQSHAFIGHITDD